VEAAEARAVQRLIDLPEQAGADDMDMSLPADHRRVRGRSA
jgi:hypothetical protein